MKLLEKKAYCAVIYLICVIYLEDEKLITEVVAIKAGQLQKLRKKVTSRHKNSLDVSKIE